MSGGLTRRRWLGTVVIYAVPFLLAMLVAPLFGGVRLDVGTVTREIFSGAHGTDAKILLQYRVPRVLLALLAGGALALVGACFQVVLRNPLAEPFTLGVTGGAAVGAVLAMYVPGLSIALGPFSSVQLLAMAGAAGALGLVYRLAKRPHGVSMNTILLAGVTVSILSGGVILFIRSLSDPYTLIAADRWLMGGLVATRYSDVGALLPFLFVGATLLFLQARALNQFSLGEEMAAGHGVEVARVQKLTFVAGGLLTAAAVSLTGPIGFVGLIVPHAVRRLSGFDQRIVLPCSFLLGGAFLAASDAVARTLFAPLELPVGVITAIVGGPLFIRILLGRRR